MKTNLSLAAIAISFGALLPVAAHADTIETFSFSADLVLQNGTDTGTASGTVAFDATTGLFVPGGSLTAYLPGISYLFDTYEFGGPNDTVTFGVYTSSASVDAGTFQIAIPGLSDIGYAGGMVCSSSNQTGCDVGGMEITDYYYYTGEVGTLGAFLATDGSLTLLSPSGTSATPEPSSLALLGTGALGLAGMVRRRFSSK